MLAFFLCTAMNRLLVFATSALLLAGIAPQAWSQSLTAAQQSQDLASAFGKAKDKVKDKKGVHTEVHLHVSNQPWLAESPAAYAGTYTAEDLGFALTVVALPGGELRLTGVEPAADGRGPARAVAYSSVQVQAGLLTATKTDEFGNGQPFAAAFLTQSRNGVLSQGLGTRLSQPVVVYGSVVLDKLFYQKQR